MAEKVTKIEIPNFSSNWYTILRCFGQELIQIREGTVRLGWRLHKDYGLQDGMEGMEHTNIII